MDPSLCVCTAAVSDPAGDDAGGTGVDPAHVHSVHQPDERRAGQHTGQRRLRPFIPTPPTGHPSTSLHLMPYSDQVLRLIQQTNNKL